MTSKRPDTVLSPHVWGTFEAWDPESDKIVKYRVQDLPSDRFDDVIQLIQTVFIRDEAMSKSKDRINDDIKCGEDHWRKGLEEKLSVVCFKEGSDEICGFNLLGVSVKDAQRGDNEQISQKHREIVKVARFIAVKADIYNRYEVDKILSCNCLLVIPKYRGLGLATEILRSSITIGKALGFKIFGGVFTGLASQKAAAKAGLEENFSVLYENLAKYEPFIEFPNISAPSLKYMSYRLKD